MRIYLSATLAVRQARWHTQVSADPITRVQMIGALVLDNCTHLQVTILTYGNRCPIFASVGSICIFARNALLQVNEAFI